MKAEYPQIMQISKILNETILSADYADYADSK
jgi:hypothetical protein